MILRHFATQNPNVGGQGRNRTTDTRIFSPLLYRLSYLAPCTSTTQIPASTRILASAVRQYLPDLTFACAHVSLRRNKSLLLWLRPNNKAVLSVLCSTD